MLKPLPLRAENRYDSAALNYVLHCLPGPLERKAAAVRQVAAILEMDGVLFGATMLGAAGPHTWLSRAVLRFLNRRRIFDNLGDTETGLRGMLAESFGTVELAVVGAVAVFAARYPRSSPT